MSSQTSGSAPPRLGRQPSALQGPAADRSQYLDTVGVREFEVEQYDVGDRLVSELTKAISKLEVGEGTEIAEAGFVEAAMRVLARQGYAHTSLMDIANEVGMSKGAAGFFNGAVAEWAKDAAGSDAALLAEATQAREKAAAAMTDFNAWLEKDLASRSNGAYAIGDFPDATSFGSDAVNAFSSVIAASFLPSRA